MSVKELILDFTITMNLETPKDIMQQRVENYFEQRGYQVKQNDNEVYYERGSWWRNYFAFNPAQWHVLAVVSLNITDDGMTMVNALLSVDSRGQIVLAREQRYWQTVFETLIDFLETGVDNKEKVLHNLGIRNQRQNYYLTIAIVIISVFIFLFLLFLLASYCPCP
jgi:hypothetical protein